MAAIQKCEDESKGKGRCKDEDGDHQMSTSDSKAKGGPKEVAEKHTGQGSNTDSAQLLNATPIIPFPYPPQLGAVGYPANIDCANKDTAPDHTRWKNRNTQCQQAADGFDRLSSLQKRTLHKSASQWDEEHLNALVLYTSTICLSRVSLPPSTSQTNASVIIQKWEFGTFPGPFAAINFLAVNRQTNIPHMDISTSSSSHSVEQRLATMPDDCARKILRYLKQQIYCPAKLSLVSPWMGTPQVDLLEGRLSVIQSSSEMGQAEDSSPARWNGDVGNFTEPMLS
ncbi:hypothetical protein VTN77DRAFT_8751 [Rasamsonia byssochlamydoides]|uniref:uncharacterized protein n=1 Tax=Rasamsonia byssochlamydoides TaxID=89139 RepID=UPI003742B5B5